MMAFIVLLLVVSATVSVRVGSTTVDAMLEPLKVGAFNVQIFGQKKITNTNVLDILIKVVNRYDIILIQEIRDQRGNAIKTLLSETNKLAAKSNNHYGIAISGGLGRSTSKEQYAFLYRTNLVSVKAQYTYNDSNDDFEREPFIVHFSVPTSAVGNMVFVAIHTKPKAAVQEIDGLVDVYDEVVKRWKINNVVIMGDLNAACSYVKDNDWKNIRLAQDKRFWWLINDCHDTSVEGSRCAYDRFVATGSELLNSIIISSAGLLDFKTVYNLSDQQAKQVSDHFPIEFHIKRKLWMQVQEDRDYILTSNLPTVTKKDVYALRRNYINLGYTLRSQYKHTGGISTITLSKNITDVKTAITSIKELRSKFPKLVTNSQVQLAQYHVSRFQIVTNKYPYQELTDYASLFMVKGIKIQLTCNVEVIPITCSLLFGKAI